MQRKGFSLIKLLVIVAGAALIAVFVFPLSYGIEDSVSKKSICQTNLRQLGIALAQYSADYNRLPPVAGAQAPKNYNTYGWADAIYVYVKSTRVYQCPKEPNPEPTTLTLPTLGGASANRLIVGTPLLVTSRNCTDHWFNANLSGIDDRKIKSPATCVLLGEGNDGKDMTDARYNYWALPAPWVNDKKSPLYRHNDKANYLFLDGHAKTLAVNAFSQGFATFEAR